MTQLCGMCWLTVACGNSLCRYLYVGREFRVRVCVCELLKGKFFRKQEFGSRPNF